MTGKTIIPFATSGGSDIGKTNERLAPSCKGAKLMDGKAFQGCVGHQELAAWVEGLDFRCRQIEFVRVIVINFLNDIRNAENPISNNRKLINTIAILLLRNSFGNFSKYLDFRQTELPGVLGKWSLRY